MTREKVCGIYKIENLVNGKVYIGQSVDIESRWREHKNISQRKTSKSYNYPLYKAFRKYGVENFSFEIVEECPVETLSEKEMFYINKYNSCVYDKNSYGYNQSYGGDGAGAGRVLSEETKQKISKNHTNVKGENAPMYGKHHTEETKRQISESRKGKYAGKNHPLYGKTVSEETRRKISIANKDSERGGKIVICENKEFSSITKCSDYYGVNRSIMGDWLNHNTAMPIEWYNKGLRYAEEKSEDYEIKEEGKNSKNEIPYKSMKKEIICEGKEFCGIKEFMSSYNISSNKRSSIVGWLSGCDPMPQEWYNKGLRYKDKNIDEYVVQKGRATGKDNKASKSVVCEGIIFDTVKQCAMHYDIKPKTMSTWLNGTRNMPQDFVNKGLKFYKEDDK